MHQQHVRLADAIHEFKFHPKDMSPPAHVMSEERVRKAIQSGRHTIGAKLRSAIIRSLTADLNEAHPFDYKKTVNELTHKVSMRVHGDLIDPDNKRSYEYHLDHIFSKKAGMCDRENGKWIPRKERIPAWAVAHPANLRILPRAENSSRHNHADPLSYSVKELKKRIKKFNSVYGDPFDEFR